MTNPFHKDKPEQSKPAPATPSQQPASDEGAEPESGPDFRPVRPRDKQGPPYRMGEGSYPDAEFDKQQSKKQEAEVEAAAKKAQEDAQQREAQGEPGTVSKAPESSSLPHVKNVQTGL